MTDYTTQRMPRAEIPGCALVQDLLPLYLDGEVTHESHVLIVDHLGRCERCSGYLTGAQSVRAQMLKEQQTFRNAQAGSPSVSQVQQPVANGFGRGLWTLLMVLSCLIGLFAITASVVGNEMEGVVIGLPLFIFGVSGLFITGQRRTFLWNALMLLSGLSGLFLVLVPILGPYSYGSGAELFVGLVLLGIAIWGLFRSRASVQTAGGTGQPSQSPFGGLGSAMFTAGWSLLAAAGLAFLAFLGLTFVAADYRAPGMQFTGVLFMLAGIAGFLELNQRRNWIAEWAAPKTKRRFQAGALFGGGVLWTLLVLQGWGIGSVAFLMTIGIGAGLTVAGLWWYQRNK